MISTKYVRLLTLHTVAAFLLLSLFVLPTKHLWQALDETIFFSLNSYIANQPVQRLFWAIANIKVTDIFGAIFLLGCYILYIFEGTRENRRERIAHLLYTLIWFEITILFSKQLVVPVCLRMNLIRHSPGAVFQQGFHLSQLLPWLKIKDFSHCCFPGDHATIVFQWCALFWYFAGWRRGLFASAVSILFLLPRLISGAHWFSDLFVGSSSIVFISFAWATHQPLLKACLDLVYRCLRIEHCKNQQREINVIPQNH